MSWRFGDPKGSCSGNQPADQPLKDMPITRKENKMTHKHSHSHQHGAHATASSHESHDKSAARFGKEWERCANVTPRFIPSLVNTASKEGCNP